MSKSTIVWLGALAIMGLFRPAIGQGKEPQPDLPLAGRFRRLAGSCRPPPRRGRCQ